MVITLPRSAALDSARPRLEAKLEQEYEGHTEVLARLMARNRRRTAMDVAALTVEVRRALADVAQALRRMAEGSYGSCELCQADIELEYLEARPAARHCLGCAPWSAA
ncbi:MAG TPA: TraR/DksA C4-type zinc finger protein [Kineosporiaceae bacterium]